VLGSVAEAVRGIGLKYFRNPLAATDISDVSCIYIYAVGKCIGQMSEQLLEVLLTKEAWLACY
jgi:hypothetical protein